MKIVRSIEIRLDPGEEKPEAHHVFNMFHADEVRNADYMYIINSNNTVLGYLKNRSDKSPKWYIK